MLALIGFKGALLAMAGVLALIWIRSLILLKKDLGKAKAKPKFRDILSKSRAINFLSAARMFLFGAHDVWFVMVVPVYGLGTCLWISSAFVLRSFDFDSPASVCKSLK
ncbi:hypothetical protein ACS77_16950 [Pseudomonas syringae]|uniref:Uncharacterized protein n=1 Tax=Pseudomonas syringae TaxID=317 RepID=A0A0L1MCK8_PSESX|nr:hypothetical protein ACS77_16950 [Pseudomonas syringae]KNH40422.1 hypothetical protein ACS73_29610 [Pseudomonas lini]